MVPFSKLRLSFICVAMALILACTGETRENYIGFDGAKVWCGDLVAPMAIGMVNEVNKETLSNSNICAYVKAFNYFEQQKEAFDAFDNQGSLNYLTIYIEHSNVLYRYLDLAHA